MAENRGKAFEDVVQKAFELIPNTSIVRLHDQTTGYLGSSNHCDFIAYREPYEYHIECKTVHGNTLSIHSIPKPDKNGILHGFYGNITDKQWEGLLEKSQIPGVFAGVLCWWVTFDTTLFLPIQTLEVLRNQVGLKSVRYDVWEKDLDVIKIPGKKKRVFFNYDMNEFFTHFA